MFLQFDDTNGFNLFEGKKQREAGRSLMETFFILTHLITFFFLTFLSFVFNKSNFFPFKCQNNLDHLIILSISKTS